MSLGDGAQARQTEGSAGERRPGSIVCCGVRRIRSNQRAKFELHSRRMDLESNNRPPVPYVHPSISHRAVQIERRWL